MEIAGVGVLLRTQEGEYVLQERDGYTSQNPRRIAPFGGAIEAGEDARTAAKRELYEELRLDVDVQEFRDVGIFASHTKPGKYIQIFLLDSINYSVLELHEGKGIAMLPVAGIFSNQKVTDFTKEVLLSLQ